MRRTILVAALAAFGGFCLAHGAAFAAARLNIWRAQGEKFQIGYVVGYLDALALSQRKDIRVQIPSVRGKNYDRWVREINLYFENPANAERSIPDAMYAVGTKIREEMLQEWQRRQQQAAPSPSPSAAP
jgi:hypothetical protein